MCQSRAQGGKRCRAHNCAAEHSRARRDATQAKKAYEELGNKYAEKLTEGTVTDADKTEIAAARADVDEKRLIEQFSNPKTAMWFKQGIIMALPEEYRTPVSDIGDSIIDHQEQAAKAAGQARTARMFYRTEEATEFDAEADDERSKAARLVNGLQGVLTSLGVVAVEVVTDTVNGALVDPAKGFLRTVGEVASETMTAAGEVVSETMDATMDVIGETAEGVASGVGVEPTMTDTAVEGSNHGQDLNPYLNPDQGENQGDGRGDGQDLDHTDTDDEFVGEAAAPGTEGHELRRSGGFDDAPKPKATAGTALRKPKAKPNVPTEQPTVNTEPTVNKNAEPTESANTAPADTPKTYSDPVRDHQPTAAPTTVGTTQPASYSVPVRDHQPAAASSTKPPAADRPQPSGTRTSAPKAAPIPQTAPTATPTHTPTHTPTADPFTDVTSLSDDDLLRFIADAYAARA
ncbi:hypothetical protein KIH27_15895 [Mycobacterium sp. M1]|uniref:ESX-1 secretion-associated protein EspA/EspE-like domain-containing protein n=1 Tax=Mycolicibacter acidiphilus TaxID=2835306 RepID=A0ABS5RLB4_9MYCO|nr:hypothetical protein [Mycolicibacter acidiphilus]MBS9535070.1 hypothetical protein [Mycolicibacter acidiphilus]